MTPERWIDPFEPAEGPPPQTLMAFLRWCLKGSTTVTLLAGLVSALAGTLEVATALMLGWVIDAALSSSGEGYFTENVLLLLGVTAFFIILRPIILGVSGVMQAVVVGPSLGNLILSRLHRHSLGQSVTLFDATTELIGDMIHTAAFARASLVGSVILLFTIDARSAGLLALWAISYIALIRFFMPRIRERSKARAATRAMVTGQVVDTITNITTVKLFAHDDHEDRAAVDAMENYWGTAVKYGWLSASFRFWLMALGGLLPVILVGMTLYFWSTGAATAGNIAAAGAISLRLAQMTGWVSFTLMAIYSNIGEVEDGMRTLTPRARVEDAPDAKVLDVPKGEIALDHKGYAYGRDTGGIQDISLTIKPGEKVGIVGASGAGKSTLVSLLLRLYEPENGRILIDGQDTKAVTQDSLRHNIGMVTQETAMFNRSARDNILYGRPHADEAAMIAAAKKAEAHDFILDLQDHRGRQGYEAHLGERGVKLSGGQRQRIALARAILKDAPILVLDEATSALDSEVEAAIQTALSRVMEGKTVLAIAHRLSTLTEMDRIVVMDDGRIVEEGSHDTLLAKGGLYAGFWARQSGGFIATETDADTKAAE